MLNPCVLCGKHEAITEYFDDELYAYCPTYNENVSLVEYDEEMERLVEIGEAECIHERV